MKTSKMLRLATLGMLLASMPTWTTGCSTQPLGHGDEPPEIPPASTFVIDFDAFTDEAAERGLPEQRDPTPGQAVPGTDWGFAAFNVGAWSVVISVGLAVPVAAFLESFNHVPQQREDGTWIWSYDVTVGGIVHSAKLHAFAVGGDIEWDMFISKEGFYEDFNWYSGVSNLPGTEGAWTLNMGPDDPTPFVGIDWHRSADGDTGDIKYTNIVPGGPENGGYILHGITDDTLDAFFEIYNRGQDNLTNVEWSQNSKQGRVRDSSHFGDEAWHCWDVALQNVACE